LFLMPGTSTTSTYTLSLHDALPIWLPEWEAGLPAPLHELHVRERQPGRSGVALAGAVRSPRPLLAAPLATGQRGDRPLARSLLRSEEHTSELQSRVDLVCRLLLEKT